MYLHGKFCLKNNHAPKYFTFDWLSGNTGLNLILTYNNKLISGYCHVYSFCIFKLVSVLYCISLIMFNHAGSLRHLKDFGLYPKGSRKPSKGFGREMA